MEVSMNNRSGSIVFGKSLSGSFRCSEHTTAGQFVNLCVQNRAVGPLSPKHGRRFCGPILAGLMGCAGKSSSRERFVLERQFWSSAARQGGEL